MTDQTLKDIDRAFKALEERDELIDKIRAEITEEAECTIDVNRAGGLYKALQIINKCKAESEE